MKKFLIGTLKIAVALIIVGIVLGLSGWGIVSYQENSERIENEPLSAVKDWPDKKIAALGDADVTLTTRWRNGRMDYQFSIQNISDELRDKFQDRIPSSTGFNIIFYDVDGFNVNEYTINNYDLTKVINSDGEVTGLYSNGDTYLSADRYREAYMATNLVTMTRFSY